MPCRLGQIILPIIPARWVHLPVVPEPPPAVIVEPEAVDGQWSWRAPVIVADVV